MKVYVIHLETATERLPFVKLLEQLCNAQVVKGVVNEKYPTKGCLDSHLAVYDKINDNDNQPIIVLEDDAFFKYTDFLSLEYSLDKEKLKRMIAKINHNQFDIIYMGYNGKLDMDNVWGTHAMIINKKAIDCLKLTINKYPEQDKIDWLWNITRKEYNLKTYCVNWFIQFPGLKSSITGNIRE